MKKVVIISNAPAPYRDPVYELLSLKEDIDLTLIYCSKIEPKRNWSLRKYSHKTLFLNSKTFTFGEHSFYFGFDVIKHLRSIEPEVIITTSLAFPMLLSFLYAYVNDIKHIYFTDATLVTEAKLSIIHKLLRRIIFSKSKAFIGPSDASKELYKSYGISEASFFKSHLCVDNKKYLNGVSIKDRKYELLFVGQFIDRKCPDFFVSVVCRLAIKLGSCNVRIVGSGPLQETFIQKLKSTNANITFDGFVQQDKLPDIYRSSKLLLMPTKEDCWGVVANEALASGTPVVTNKEAGVAGELVIEKTSGRVLELNVSKWTEEIMKLLTNEELLQRMSDDGVSIVSNYTFTNARKGIYDAIQSV